MRELQMDVRTYHRGMIVGRCLAAEEQEFAY